MLWRVDLNLKQHIFVNIWTFKQQADNPIHYIHVQVDRHVSDSGGGKQGDRMQAKVY